MLKIRPLSYKMKPIVCVSDEHSHLRLIFVFKTFSIMGSISTLRKVLFYCSDECHYALCRYAECCDANMHYLLALFGYTWTQRCSTLLWSQTLSVAIIAT